MRDRLSGKIPPPMDAAASSWSFFHPGLLSGDSPRAVLLGVPPLYSLSSRCSWSTDAAPIPWSDTSVSSCFLSHSLPQWGIFVQMRYPGHANQTTLLVRLRISAFLLPTPYLFLSHTPDVVAFFKANSFLWPLQCWRQL